MTALSGPAVQGDNAPFHGKSALYLVIALLVHVTDTHLALTSVHAGLELRVFKVKFNRVRAVRLVIGVVQACKVRVTQCLGRGQALGRIEGQQSLEQ